MDVQFFNNKIEKFIAGLEKMTIAKVLHTIDLLVKFGSNLGMPHAKKICDGVFELRIRGNQEVRIFYTFHRSNIIVLHGFVKKTQKLPKKELEIALKRLNELA